MLSLSFQNPNETLYGNYHAYLCEARFEIASRSIACSAWTYRYEAVSPKREANNNTSAKEIDGSTAMREQDSLISICTSGYDTLKTSGTPDKEPHSLTSLLDETDSPKGENETKDHDSISSVGETYSDQVCNFFFLDHYLKSHINQKNIVKGKTVLMW